MKEIKIRVPATTANLGPGFDCLGMALELFNEITIKTSDKLSITVEGEVPLEGQNMVYQAIQTLFHKVGKPIPPLSLFCLNRIPLARGLGSSAAAIAGGLLAANHLLGQPFSKRELIQIGCELEGHPDNIVPAILGGCHIVIREDNELIHFPIPIPQGLKAILFIPDFPIPTKESRQILPPQISREEVVYNLGRIALLVASFFSGDLKFLRYGMEDKIHQPARSKLFPAMEDLFKAALKAGALGVCLSGGGSSILALSLDRGDKIARVWEEETSRAGISGKTLITCPTELGAYLEER